MIQEINKEPKQEGEEEDKETHRERERETENDVSVSISKLEYSATDLREIRNVSDDLWVQKKPT